MTTSAAARGAVDLGLDPGMAARLRARLPAVAEQTVEAVVAEVPGYAAGLTGDLRANIERAVRMALQGFVTLAQDASDNDPGTPLQPALAGAYELGRGEARAGRSMDALQAAYRVGARVSWRELAEVMVEEGLSAADVARFAELVFAYIDELSAASVAGHADEHATTGRVRELQLERLGRQLVEGAAQDVLAAAAERADWEPPTSLAAILVPEAQVRPALARLDARTLRVPGDLVGAGEVTILLVPDASGGTRDSIVRAVDGLDAVVGPGREWADVASSVRRAVSARRLVASGDRASIDTEAHLATLVLEADADALADLRRRALAPLADLRPSTRDRLEETLRSWLLHQGRRDAVAAELHVHPQTVRYRMTQLRELYGDRLQDPHAVLGLVLALGGRPGARCDRPQGERSRPSAR